MALGNPIEAFLQVAQMQQRNREKAQQDSMGIGQNINQMGETIGKAVQAQRQKSLMGQLVAAMNGQGAPQQGPQMPVPAGPPIQGPSGYSPPNQTGSSAIPAGQIPMKMGQSPIGPAQDNDKLIQSLIMQMNPAKGIDMLSESPWKVVPNMLAGTNPIQENKITGKVRPVDINVTPTGRGNSSFGNALKWNEMPPEIQNLGKEIYENHIQLGKLGYRERSQGVLAAIAYGQENGLPPFKSYGADVAGKTAEAFAVGKPGTNVNSLNTALGHVNAVYDAFQGVSNTDQKWLNQPMNKLRMATGDPNVAKLGTSLNALRGELATVFKGSAGTDQEIASWMNYLNDSLSPQQVMAVIPQVDELLRSRLSALNYQRESGMSGRGEAPLLSPHAAEFSKKFQSVDKPIIENGWIYTPGLGGKANQANWKKQ